MTTSKKPLYACKKCGLAGFVGGFFGGIVGIIIGLWLRGRFG